MTFGAASPEAAWRNGVSAAQAKNFGQALRWLERAVRLAPGDPRIALDLGNIRLQAGGAVQIGRAAAAFETLAARYDVASCWLGLLAARRLQGEHARAAAALQQLLSRHCIPQDPGFSAVASAVAQAAGWPGWCGINAEGSVQIAADHVPANLPDLLGSPLSPAIYQRCEGVVESAGAALTGWVSRPAAPLVMPELFLCDTQGRRRKITIGDILPANADAPLTTRYAFRCPVPMLAGLTPPFHVFGPDGVDLLGSPVDPRAALEMLPIPADYLGSANRTMPAPARLMVVVPVYRGLQATQACLNAVILALPAAGELIVVDDASPEPELAAWLDRFCLQSRVRLIRHAKNLGFPAAANAGLRAAEGCDVLLLNSDTLLPPAALQTLLAAVYAQPDIGSATPFSNEATICSYPVRTGGNAAPDLAAALALDAAATRANGQQVVEIPTGVGFCLLMRHDCIARTGLLRADIFAQGYGEEVDWCLRARHRGYRHVVATGAYVAHLGKISFGAAGQALNMRNARLLGRLYPGYEKLILAHAKADPLAAARRRLDAVRFGAAVQNSAVLLISHQHGGGVARRVEAEMRAIRQAGQRPILLTPKIPEGRHPARAFYPTALSDGAPGDYPNLVFALPEEEPALLHLLHAEQIVHVILHHGLGQHPALRGIARRLGVPQDIVVHDYASFCPRVHLMGPAQRYCGEPEVQACISCVADAGDETAEGLTLHERLARSAAEFGAARSVIAPSQDASRRITRHFPDVIPMVTPWEDDRLPLVLNAPKTGRRRVVVLGGVGPAKGYDILLECAQDAGRRDLPVDFILAGGSYDDERLLQTGRIFITGYYAPNDLPQLLTDLRADLAFIPSIWPETWCFTLGEAWAAGLYTIAFDLGAQAERIAATRRGGLLPLGLPAPRINDALLAWHPALIEIA